MSYTPGIDYVALWRNQIGGATKAEMPGLDFAIAALHRAGLINVHFSDTQPTSNQARTMWFRPARPTYSGEGVLYLWNGVAYVAATPELFHPLAKTTTLTFSLTQAEQIVLTPNVWTIIKYAGVPQTDLHAAWDASTGKLTPKVAGFYNFSVRCYAYGPANTGGGVNLIKNDDGVFDDINIDVVVASSNAPKNQLQTANGVAYMNGTTDYVRVFGFSGASLEPMGTIPAFSALLMP